jgi:hypothetical protein
MRRKNGIFFRSLLLILGVLVLCLADFHPVLSADDSILGITTSGEWADPRTHVLAVDAGARWVRTSVSWASHEPVQGQRNLSDLEGFFKTFTDIGLRPIVYIADNPSWAASSKCGPLDKVSPQALADFVGALAERYPSIDYWALYNEPDIQWTTGEASTFGGCWGRNGQAYAKALGLVKQAVQGANPNAQVVFSGIAAEKVTCPSTWTTCAGQDLFNFNINGGDFVDDVLGYIQAHPGDYFDVFDFHYYPAFHGQWDSYGKGILGKAQYYQNRLASHGLNKPMICTETGRRSDTGQVIDGIPGSDAEQSKYLVKTYIRAMAGGLKSVLWFTFADQGTSAWGLLDGNYVPKASYKAYQVLGEQVEGALFNSELPLAGGQEGYAFDLPDGENLWVVWGSGNITIPSTAAQRIGRLGAASILTSDQGTIIAAINDSPLYFRFSSSTPYALTITKNGTGTGTVSSDPVGPSFAAGTVVTLTATPDASSNFAGWSRGGCTGTSLTCQATLNSNVTVTATFNLKAYTISATAGPNGSISPSGTVTVNWGSSATFTITPKSGFMVADVIIDGTSRGPKTSKTFSNVTANHTIVASFTPLLYSLSIANNGTGTGTVSSNPAGSSFAPRTVVTLTAKPAAGSKFAGWSGGCTGTSLTCQVTLNSNVSVTATFNLKTYTITATTGVNGSISPSGAVTVNWGSSQTFTITPKTGYRIANVKVDGVSQGAISSYTFSNVKANHSIAASYALLTP